jgi:cell wall-associated NlpC family hydrolase
MRFLRVAALATVPVITISLGGTYLLATTILAGSSDTAAIGGSSSCSITVRSPASNASLDQEQITNARTIVQVGVSLSVPPRGYVVAIATALQESNLRNLHYGDRDSVGLFQQRPSSGWGTVSELTDPPTSARKFYEALLKVEGWQSMPLTVAAQRVQRSAFPLAYEKWETLSQTLVTQMIGSDSPQPALANSLNCGQAIGTALPTGIVGEMLQVARSQLGKPYLWGATGPSRFDCSGLVVYAWSEVGYPLRVRTSEQMYQVSDRIASGSEQPGDLLFTHFAGAGPGHVMIVIRPGIAIEAPRKGDVVKIIPYDSNKWVVGRLTARAFISGTVPS